MGCIQVESATHVWWEAKWLSATRKLCWAPFNTRSLSVMASWKRALWTEGAWLVFVDRVRRLQAHPSLLFLGDISSLPSIHPHNQSTFWLVPLHAEKVFSKPASGALLPVPKVIYASSGVPFPCFSLTLCESLSLTSRGPRELGHACMFTALLQIVLDLAHSGPL